jgi:hypothetical protein
MNFTLKTAAQSLLILAASMTAVAQSEISPDHFSDGPSQEAYTSQTQVQTLQSRLEDCQRQLDAKVDQVEQARQEAISAAALGDGAASYIDSYRKLQVEEEVLRAALVPQINQAHKLMAGMHTQDPRPRLP